MDGSIKKLVMKSAAAGVTDFNYCKIMTSYIMHDILKPSAFWKIWRRGALYVNSRGASDGLDPALNSRPYRTCCCVLG